MKFSAIHADRNCLWMDTGRAALFVAAKAIRSRGGKPCVWVPAYSCESVSQPLLQAGFSIRYYHAGSDLGCGESALPQPKPGETLLFIHYFGHYNVRMATAAREFRAAGVWIIEDCAQASLMAGTGKCADFTITSYRKVLPVVDGSALLCEAPISLSEIGLEIAPPDETFISAKLMGKFLRGASMDAPDFLPLIEMSELRLQNQVIPRHISWLSTWMMERLDWDAARAKRRTNWLALSAQLKVLELEGKLTQVFTKLKDDEVPLGLSIRVAGGQRGHLRHFLAGRNIYCPIHWPLEHLPGGEPFPDDRELAATELTLPTDQRMSVKHIDRLAAEVVSFFNRAQSAQ